MNIAQAILEPLQKQGNKVICRDSQIELTADQLLQTCRSAAGNYQAAVAGPRVGILLPICASYAPAVVGAIWAGKVPVLLNPLLKPSELEFIFQEAAIDAVVTAGQMAASLTGLPVKILEVANVAKPGAMKGQVTRSAEPGDVAVLMYTSGTTGRPKGVPLTHHNLLSNAHGVIDRFRAYPDDVFLGVLPLFHAFGLLGTMLVPLLLGAEVNYTRFTPERVAALIAERNVKIFIGVPSMYRLLVRSKLPGESLQGLRLAVSGGDALPARVRDDYRQRFGRELLEGYGLTETSPVISVNSPEDNRPGTVGRRLPDVNVRIQRDDGAQQAPGRDGEIQVQGPNVMAGYYNRPDENRQAFTPDGWFRTGDSGHLDSDGYLTISGRIKELIIRDGEKVMPREVEEVLEQHPKVLDVAVLGQPDGKHGEAVVAFVTPAEQAPTAEELHDFCRSRLADFKVPRRIVIATDLPRGPTGKILKRAVKEWKAP